MDLNKRKIALATACVFILLAVIYAIMANNAYRRDYQQAITKAELTAKVDTGELERDFHQGISLTKALEDVIISGRGEVHDFPLIAENLMEPYISSIQIAPDGVVTDIYPLQGNEAGLIDLIHDPVRGPVFLDIDDFKIINDLHGHDIGDEALKNLANNLLKVFDGAAVVSRTGGDEFGIFIPGKTAEEAEPLIRAASAMDQTFTTSQGKTYTYTISMGYSDYPAQAGTREELARNVDCALYNVKLSGKHGCQRFVPGMIKKSREQLGFSQSELLN